MSAENPNTPEAPSPDEYTARTRELLDQFWSRESLKIAMICADKEESHEYAEREHTFVEHLVARIDRECAEHPSAEVVVLFDIDRTIGTVDFDTKNPKHMEFRPSIEPALILLNDKNHFPGVRCGILTSRLTEDLELDYRDAYRPTSIQPLARYIDPELVYSTEGGHGEAKVATLDSLETEHPGRRFILVEDTPPEQPDPRILDIRHLAYDS